MNSKKREKLIRRWSLLIIVLIAFILVWIKLPFIALGVVLSLLLQASEIKILDEREIILKISYRQVSDWLLAK